MAELPKDERFGSPAFLFCKSPQKVGRMIKEPSILPMTIVTSLAEKCILFPKM
jgi:hypothetical protein